MVPVQIWRYLGNMLSVDGDAVEDRI